MKIGNIEFKHIAFQAVLLTCFNNYIFFKYSSIAITGSVDFVNTSSGILE